MKKPCSFQPIINPYKTERPINWSGQFHRCAPIEVEIGFGMGEMLMRQARQNPERDFVGIEQHWERIYKTLRSVTKYQSAYPKGLGNIRILRIDARVCFERLFDSKSIDAVYCLFPCPWPKKGHIKHRLFTNDFLKILNNRLKINGSLKIVTDFYPYYEWVLEQGPNAGFQIGTRIIEPTYNTKFERKWREEGQQEFFEINFLKKQHIAVPVKEDVILKGYVLKEFIADHFRLEDVKGDISVIFKGMISDEKKQKTMVHVLVAEPHMTQHLWITIIRKNHQWFLARTDGQNFFPTPGIAEALDIVYQAAKKTVEAGPKVSITQ